MNHCRKFRFVSSCDLTQRLSLHFSWTLALLGQLWFNPKAQPSFLLDSRITRAVVRSCFSVTKLYPPMLHIDSKCRPQALRLLREENFHVLQGGWLNMFSSRVPPANATVTQITPPDPREQWTAKYFLAGCHQLSQGLMQKLWGSRALCPGNLGKASDTGKGENGLGLMRIATGVCPSAILLCEIGVYCRLWCGWVLCMEPVQRRLTIWKCTKYHAHTIDARWAYYNGRHQSAARNLPWRRAASGHWSTTNRIFVYESRRDVELGERTIVREDVVLSCGPMDEVRWKRKGPGWMKNHHDND
jgi:hypothetical protein